MIGGFSTTSSLLCGQETTWYIVGFLSCSSTTSFATGLELIEASSGADVLLGGMDGIIWEIDWAAKKGNKSPQWLLIFTFFLFDGLEKERILPFGPSCRPFRCTSTGNFEVGTFGFRTLISRRRYLHAGCGFSLMLRRRG
jgi:hypothetical protein